jgi:hypothetical protein
VDAVPIIDALLGEEIGPSQMLGLIIAYQAMKEEGEGIFRLFHSVIEPAGEDGILDSAKLSSLALNLLIG